MSLRKQLHNAIDEVTLPAPDLESRVTAFVFADERRRRQLAPAHGRSRWIAGLRGMRAVVAALLVVALLGGLILGGRWLRDMTSSPLPAVDQLELHNLEARPLVAMPTMPSTGECPVGPLSTDFTGDPAVGDGLMRVHVGMPSTYNTDWGTWNISYFVVNPTEHGLFLVRARDLKSTQSVFFAGNISGVADAQIGRAVLAGKVAGPDTVNGQAVDRYRELVINASAPSDFAKTTSKAPQWGAYVGYAKGSSGCTFFQVDHAGGTETFIYGY